MLYCSNEKHRTPGGRYSLLYADMANQTHLLIAGRTGSGKSVVVNGIIHSLLVGRTCSEEQLILIDPKRVELSMWKTAPHCMYYAADNPVDRLHALNLAVATIEKRFAEMDRAGEKKYAGGDRRAAAAAKDRPDRPRRESPPHRVYAMPDRSDIVNPAPLQF